MRNMKSKRNEAEYKTNRGNILSFSPAQVIKMALRAK